jgi:hypothetical protein
MSTNPRKRGSSSRKGPTHSRTTADATPTLAGMVRAMPPGPALDEQIGRAFARLGQTIDTVGLSTTWGGAQQLIERLTALGYYLELQTHANRSLCRILKVLTGNAISKQLASTDAVSLPEAVAKAALLTLLETEPPSI